MQAVKDSSHLYDVERRARHAERPGFRITELQISPTQQVPWHYHTNVHDTFYVLEGELRLSLRDPKEEVRLAPGQTYAVRPGRPHLVRKLDQRDAVDKRRRSPVERARRSGRRRLRSGSTGATRPGAPLVPRFHGRARRADRVAGVRL